MRPLSILIILLFLVPVSAQYQGPESVEYDPVGDRYFVSNTQSASIKVRSQAGVVTDFVTGTPNAPYGLEIMGEVLYACMGNGVRGYDLATGQQVYVRNLGALFPNGITTDGTHLYITDFNSNARRIYKVDPIADTHITLVANTGGQPNGIVWDSPGDRLVVVFWGSGAPIKAYDRMSGAEILLVANSGLGNLDGVTIDCDGDFLVSSWSPARISRFTAGFALPAENLGIAGLNNPADIDFDPVHQRVCIPSTGNNTVTLFDVDCLPTSVEDLPMSAPQVWPNPTHGPLWVLQADNMPYALFDALGTCVATGTLRSDRPLDLQTFPSGVYLLQLNGGQVLRVVRE